MEPMTGCEVVARGGVCGEGFALRFRLKEDADDDHFAKIGSLAMGIEWAFAKQQHAATDGYSRTDEEDDPLDINALLDEAITRPNSIDADTTASKGHQPPDPTTCPQEEGMETRPTSVEVEEEHVVTRVVSEDETASCLASDDDGSSGATPTLDLDGEQTLVSLVGERGRRTGKQRGNSSILMVRIRQLRICVGDLCSASDTTMARTDSTADTSVGVRFQSAEPNIGRRMASLAARLLREIVAHLGKKGVIARNIL